jgi:hypothetical protein
VFLLPPKVLFESVERIGRSGVGFGGVDLRVLFIPSYPGTTGLTGVSPLWDLSQVICWTRVSLGRFGAGQFLSGFGGVLLGFVNGSSSLLVVFWGCFCSRA